MSRNLWILIACWVAAIFIAFAAPYLQAANPLTESERVKRHIGLHCGCKAPEGSCSIPCDSCCAPIMPCPGDPSVCGCSSGSCSCPH
jgi:hypothetical protein